MEVIVGRGRNGHGLHRPEQRPEVEDRQRGPGEEDPSVLDYNSLYRKDEEEPGV